MHSAIFTNLHELEVADGYRWKSNEQVLLKKKMEPNKSVSISGVYQIGKNMTQKLTAGK